MLEAIKIRSIDEDTLYERLGNEKAELAIQDRAKLSGHYARLLRNNKELIWNNKLFVERRLREFGLARMARALEVTKTCVNRWCRDGVPPERVPTVSLLLGLTYHDIRPDIFPRGV